MDAWTRTIWIKFLAKENNSNNNKAAHQTSQAPNLSINRMQANTDTYAHKHLLHMYRPYLDQRMVLLYLGDVQAKHETDSPNGRRAVLDVIQYIPPTTLHPHHD